MAWGSHRPHSWGRERAAVGELFFCAELVILPSLAITDLAVWRRCRQRQAQTCIRLIEDGIIQGAMAELGTVFEPISR